MASLSGCFFLVSMVISLSFLLRSSSTLASTKYIDTICNYNSFCLQTLTAYPPAVSETNMVKLVKIAVGLGASHAIKTIGFVAELAKEPTFKKHFKLCNESYSTIVSNLRAAISYIGGVDEDACWANFEAFRCYDETHNVKEEIGNNTDKASKKLMEMTLLMEKFINMAEAATNSIL